MYGQGQHIVLVDANVFYSRTLRDWVMLLALIGPESYQIRYTEDILVETLYHLRKNHPNLHSAAIEDVREKIESAFEGCKVVGYPIDPGFLGADPHDAHVHSAALASQADILLTCDVGGFIGEGQDSDDLPYEVWHPDDFLTYVAECAPDVVQAVTKRQMTYWAARRGDVDLPQRLREAGAPQFAECVRRHLQLIALRGE